MRILPSRAFGRAWLLLGALLLLASGCTGGGGDFVQTPTPTGGAGGPTVTGLDPSPLAPGVRFTITGSGFGEGGPARGAQLQGGSYVSFVPPGGGTGVQVSRYFLWSDTRIEAEVPETLVAGQGYVVVVTVVTPQGVISSPTTGGPGNVVRVGLLAWRWQNPLPQGSTLLGVWAASANDTFAVGFSGTIVHFNGSTFTTMESGTTKHLYGVWGSSASDVFAVGDGGTIVHFNGSTWSPMTSGTTQSLLGVWGSGASDVFAVGSNGTILHYGGAAWSATTPLTNDTLTDVWGSGPNDFFAVSYSQGLVLHYNGSSWQPMSIPVDPERRFRAVWGGGPNDVFAVGDVGRAYHYDGTAWTSQQAAPQSDVLYGVWGSTGNDVWAVGSLGRIVHYDGSSWSTATGVGTPQLWGVGGGAANQVLAVGSNGTILRFNGSTWSSASSSVTGEDLRGVWGSAGDDVFAVGASGTMLHHDGTGWTTVASGTTQSLRGVWGSGPGDVFAVGQSGTILHYDGSAWSSMSSSGPHLWAVGGTGPTDVWAAGNGEVRHFDGTSWTSQPIQDFVFGLWAGGPGQAWCVGNNSIVWQNQGASWTGVFTSQASYLLGIWGASPTDLFAVGYDSTILHYDGSTWTESYQADGWELTAVGGTAGDDVFVVGEGRNPSYGGASILHYDGAAWTPQASVGPELRGVWAASPVDVYAVGDGGAILHYSIQDVVSGRR